AVRFEDSVMSGLLAVGQSVEGVELCGVLELLGEGAAGMLEDEIGGEDQPLRAIDVTQLGYAEVAGAERGSGLAEVNHQWAPSEGRRGASLTLALVYIRHRGNSSVSPRLRHYRPRSGAQSVFPDRLQVRSRSRSRSSRTMSRLDGRSRGA